MRKIFFSIAIIVAIQWSMPASAVAENENLQTARDTFSAGQKLFNEGDYEGARDKFRQSLQAFPHFRTVFNIALCEEKLGNISEAVKMYEEYIDWPTEVPSRQAVTKKVEQLKKKLPGESGDPEEQMPDEETALASKDGTLSGTLEEQISAQVAEGAYKDELNNRYEVPGWITLGAGAAGVLVGSVLLGVAHSKLDEMRAVEKGGYRYDADKHDALVDDGKKLQLAGWLTGGLGLVSVGTGALMLIFSKTAEHERPPLALSLGYSRHTARAELIWRF